MVRQLGLHEARHVFHPRQAPANITTTSSPPAAASSPRIDMECPVHSLERKLEKSSGFHHVYA